jgi:hypothetical protein
MIFHSELGVTDFTRRRKLKILIKENKITLGGNIRLKIYGLLTCASGKRMKIENRVFFISGEEATREGYRPCGHCMKEEYRRWKINLR